MVFVGFVVDGRFDGVFWLFYLVLYYQDQYSIHYWDVKTYVLKVLVITRNLVFIKHTNTV